MIVAPVFRLSGLPASELKRTNLPPPVTYPNFQMENIRFVDRIVVLSGERKANKKATDRSVALKGSLSGYRDSNSGPPTPEAGALTGLRYIPKTCRTEIVPKHRTGTPPVKELPFSDRRGNKIRTCDPLLPKQVVQRSTLFWLLQTFRQEKSFSRSDAAAVRYGIAYRRRLRSLAGRSPAPRPFNAGSGS